MATEIGQRQALAAQLSWRTPQGAIWLICRLRTLGHIWKIPLVVGTLLTLVNLGGALLTAMDDREMPVLLAVRIAANYLIPYTVASLGFLQPFRVEG